MGGVPHLKTGRSARVAVSPPSSTKKININSGWGYCEVGDGLDWWGNGSMLKVTGIAELRYIRIDRDETAKIKPAG